MTCDAGCVLEVLDNWLAEKGYMMPLDLGAKGRYVIRFTFHVSMAKHLFLVVILVETLLPTLVVSVCYVMAHFMVLCLVWRW